MLAVRHPYFQTMAHQPMEINSQSSTCLDQSRAAEFSLTPRSSGSAPDWIEIDSAYTRDLAAKKLVIEEHGDKVLNSLPENDFAASELLDTLVDYLPKRYPTLFERTASGGIWNKVTNERFEDTASLDGKRALLVVSRLVQDDFLMGLERADGHVCTCISLSTLSWLR